MPAPVTLGDTAHGVGEARVSAVDTVGITGGAVAGRATNTRPSSRSLGVEPLKESDAMH